MAEVIKPHEVPAYTRMTGEVYDLIYADKNYEGEARKLAELIHARLKSGGNRLLEAACGTGSYLKFLAEEFQSDGFDLSPEQVSAARKKVPGAHIVEADMTDFDMGASYDTVVCLFSSIGYVKTPARMAKAIAGFAKHLKSGGVLVVEPWLKPEAFKEGHFSQDDNRNEHMAVSRMGRATRDGNVSIIHMHHMIGSGDQVEHFLENHELGMFTEEEFAEAFAHAGLNFEFDPEGLTGRGLYIGVKNKAE